MLIKMLISIMIITTNKYQRFYNHNYPNLSPMDKSLHPNGKLLKTLYLGILGISIQYLH